MSNCIPYKIKVTRVGVSTSLFSIKYTTVGDSNLQTALNLCGAQATSVTAAEILAGYSVCLPSNVNFVYIYDIGGNCEGRYTVITI